MFIESGIKSKTEDKEIRMEIAILLLAWYEGSKRDLPWRRDKDPYKIWVSEVMLQQTRVEAVKPYFEKWITRFPTLQSLAIAQEEEVIQYWQGLGYYSRARNLLQGVREVTASYGGQIPDTKKAVAGLTGIGDYTSGAILSIAYNKKEPAIDGNVLRVFSRLYCIEDDIASQKVKGQIRELVEKELPSEQPGDFNQAIMDLGAMICIPKTPRCEICPLETCCCAKEQGIQGQLPFKKKKTPPLPVKLLAGIVQDGERFLLHKRPATGLLAGMWEFPTVEIPEGADEREIFQRGFLCDTGQEIEMGELLFHCIHVFSHRRWDISFYHCVHNPSNRPLGEDVSWLKKEEWEKISFAGPHRKMAAYLLANSI